MSESVLILRAEEVAAGAMRVRKAAFESVDRATRAAAVARAEAEAIRAQAKAEAARIREAAEAAAEQVRAEARAAGERAAAERLAAGEVALRAEAVALREAASDRLVRLATLLAGQVLEQELATRSEAVLALARKALRQVSWCARAAIRLCPEDAARLRQDFPALWGAVEGGSELTVVPDPSLSRGDCVVETEAGVVDGSVRLQLSALQDALLKAPEGGEAPEDPVG